MYSKAEYIARMELVGNILADFYNGRITYGRGVDRLVREAKMDTFQAEATLNEIGNEYGEEV